MSFISDNRHSFVIQLWCEPREIENAPEQWRGIVEHTSSGQRKAVFTTEDIVDFIAAYVSLPDQSQSHVRSLKDRLSRYCYNSPSNSEPSDT